MTKKLLALLCAACLVLTVAGCSKTGDTTEQTQPAGAQPLVGISLADQNSELSVQLAQQLETQGFSVSVLCAQGNAKTQAGQLQTLLAAGAKCLIVQAVDSLALQDVEAAAKEKNVPIIACDALLMDTDWVWGYISYDYYALGVKMAQKVVAAKALDSEDTKPQTIEFFMGAPENQNSFLLHQGALSVLQPYLNSGKLICRSGRTAFEDTYTTGTTDAARRACTDRLQSSYEKKKLDICFAGTDDIAAGCRQALDKAGYTRETWPVLIGQGGANAQAVKDGYQLATYEKNNFVMARTCEEMVRQALAGEAFTGDGSLHDNHVISVPGKLLPVVEVDS